MKEPVIEGVGSSITLTRVANGYLLHPAAGGDYKDYFVFTSKETLAEWIKVHGINIPPEVDKRVEDLPF